MIDSYADLVGYLIEYVFLFGAPVMFLLFHIFSIVNKKKGKKTAAMVCRIFYIIGLVGIAIEVVLLILLSMAIANM